MVHEAYRAEIREWFFGNMLANSGTSTGDKKMNTSAVRSATSIRDLMGKDVYDSLDEQQKTYIDFSDRCIARMRECDSDDSEESLLALMEIPPVEIISGVISNLSQVMKGYEKNEYPRTATLDLANYALIADQQFVANNSVVDKAAD